MGGDFNKVSEKYTNKPAKESDQYSDQLAPALKEVMDRLSPGEAAPPFLHNGQWLLIKLTDLRKSRVEPLEVVAHMISVKLQQEKLLNALHRLLKNFLKIQLMLKQHLLPLK